MPSYPADREPVEPGRAPDNPGAPTRVPDGAAADGGAAADTSRGGAAGGLPKLAGRGLQALNAEQFSVSDAVGGVRGMIESLAPGLVFVVVFIATRELSWALISSVVVAVVAVIARLVQRTPMTQALGGMLGVAIGVVWAWRSGEAQNYFAFGLWTNAGYLLAMAASVLVRWPLVGLVLEFLRASTDLSVFDNGFRSWAATWRGDRNLMRRYNIATLLWVAMFALRLAVQVPLYLDGDVGWLGTARLVMGVPLWGLVLWGTWVLVRHQHRRPLRPTEDDDARLAAEQA